MALHQVCDFRLGNPRIMFGSDDAYDAWVGKCHAALKRQTVRFAVAPLCAIRLPSGRALQTGAEVTLRDLEGDHQWHPLRRLRDLIDHAEVLVRDDIGIDPFQPEPERPQAA